MSIPGNERIRNYLFDLVKIPSVTGSSSEKDAALYIHGALGSLPYFQNHPEGLVLIESRDQGQNHRTFSVMAMVKGARPTRRTVLMISHLDVVDIDVYGPYKDLAYSPDELTDALLSADLPPAAKADLESGNWLFGRGMMDMKLGVALEMDLITQFTKNPDLFDLNLVFLCVCDEENNSAGMRSSVVHLANLCQDQDLDLVAALNTEPTDAGTSRAERPGIFSGCVGKIMPMFYVQGKVAHVGNYYHGLSAALITSYLTQSIEANPDLADQADGETTLPYIALNQKCIQKGYSVTIPDKSLSYYHYSTLTKTPSQVLDEMLNAARKAAKKTQDHLAESALKMSQKGYDSPSSPQWPITIMTFQELRQRVDAVDPSLSDRIIDRCTHPYPKGRDLREISINILEKMLEAIRLEEAAIIVGFLPPFYPHRTSTGQSAKEQMLQKAIAATIDHAAETYHQQLDRHQYFAGICDLSYIGGQIQTPDLTALTQNLPGWEQTYTIPFEAIAQLNAPIVNIGPLGRDAHKYTERLDLPYALNVLPNLIQYFIKQLE